MKNKNTLIPLIQNIIVSLFFLSIGILFFINYETVWIALYILTVIGLTLLGFSQLWSFIKGRKTKSFIDYLPMLSSFGFAIFIFIFPDNFFRFIHVVIGWWILINAIIGYINFIVYRRDSLKGASWIFIKSTIDTAFALTLILSPRSRLWILSIFAGIYFIFYGFVSTGESIKDVLPDNTKNKVRRHLTISAPVLVAAIIPQHFFFSIKQMVKQNIMELDTDAYNDDPADLEVFIYLKESGPESLGHVDISYNNQIYSYGCHDPENRELFGTLGDGVLIVSDRSSFLQNAIDGDGKTIIGYKIQLIDYQKVIIEKRLKELFSRTTEWKSKAQIAMEQNLDVDSCIDYASRVYKNCKASMFKFTQGKFKTYFVFSTNCVLLADYLVRTPELDLIKTSGIVTPGSYISFLNQELAREKSIVINRTIYQKNN
ncbi:DUF308 domain-containing protein [Anaerorhabdus sp.]|uniref:DUF308 domain-containing protein n=1 Tax=Anaerorhabdus sp. TaxID=1872524 RepID=UPI002FC6D6DB